MKAIFIIPVYKRLELTRLCVSRLVAQGKRLGFDVICVGDKEAKEYCKGAVFYEHKNNPLTGKLNFALTKCKKYDRVIGWGSDNFASDEVLKPLIESNDDVIGYDSIYFYSNRTKKASLQFSKRMTTGVGRSYSREFLEKFKYKLYNKEADFGVDTIAFNNYNVYFNEKVLNLQQGYLLDVKHEMNITNPLIVNIGQKVEPFWNDLIVELDKIKPKDKEFIKRKPINKQIKRNNMVKIEMTKEIAGMKKGVVKQVPVSTAKNLISRGLAKEVVATTKEEIITKKESNEGNSKKKQPSKGGKQGTRKASKK